MKNKTYISVLVMALALSLSLGSASVAFAELGGVVNANAEAGARMEARKADVNVKARMDAKTDANFRGNKGQGGDNDGNANAKLQASSTFDRGGKNATAICTRIMNNESLLISSLNKTLKDRNGDRKDKLMEFRSKLSDKLDNVREDHDKNKELRYAKLEASADTAAEVAALAKFKTTVDAAVTVRRTAVDSAIATYRSDVNAILAKYPVSNTASSTRASIEASIKAALEKVRVECNATSSDPQIILKNFQAALDKAKSDYKASVNVDATVVVNMRTELKAAADKRDAAIKAARIAFKTIFDAAKAELRVVFGLSADAKIN